MQAIPPEPGATTQSTMPFQKNSGFSRNCFGMTQLRSVFVVSEVKNA
jgi:hypothetical protein